MLYIALSHFVRNRAIFVCIQQNRIPTRAFSQSDQRFFLFAFLENINSLSKSRILRRASMDAFESFLLTKRAKKVYWLAFFRMRNCIFNYSCQLFVVHNVSVFLNGQHLEYVNSFCQNIILSRIQDMKINAISIKACI